MPNGLRFEEIYRLLPYQLDTPHFRIRYGPYSAGEKGQLGYRGYRGMSLVTAYAEGLEEGFDSLEKHVFKQTKPRHPIQVAVFHLPDYIAGYRNEPMTIPSSGSPRILLSNRSCEISVSARVDRARSEATHEVCHIFQIEKRKPLDDVMRSSWEWITEATAVFTEQFVHRGGAESAFYCQEWLDGPEISLDLQSYPSSMFVRWFARRFGVDRVGEIWETSGPKDTPLAVIERLTHDGIGNLFAQYARDAYFLCDSSSFCFFPDIHFLWGFREIRKHFVLPIDSGKSFEGTINHLAAGYFEIRVECGVTVVDCALEVRENAHSLCAEIVAVKRNLHKGASVEFTGDVAERLFARFHLENVRDIDHYVIVVSNGSVDGDRVPYSLTVSAGPNGRELSGA